MYSLFVALAVLLFWDINVSHSIWSLVVRWMSSHNSIAFNVCVETLHTLWSLIANKLTFLGAYILLHMPVTHMYPCNKYTVHSGQKATRVASTLKVNRRIIIMLHIRILSTHKFEIIDGRAIIIIHS